MVKGLLVECRQYPGWKMGTRAVIPDAMIKRVLHALHDDPTSGHSGVSETLLEVPAAIL